MSVSKNSEATRERILAAAEMLFAERGFGGVSLRDITARGLANVAAVNYHFGTKEALLEKVLVKYLGPVFEARMAGFDGLGEGADLGAVLDVWFDPLLVGMVEGDLEAGLFCGLVGRCMGGFEEVPEGVLADEARVRGRLVAVLGGVLGEDDVAVVERLVGFVEGAVTGALLDAGGLDAGGVRELMGRLRDFCLFGISGGGVDEVEGLEEDGGEVLEEGESPFVRVDGVGDRVVAGEEVEDKEKKKVEVNDDEVDEGGVQNEFLF